MEEFDVFENDAFRIRLPKHLRPKKGGAYFVSSGPGKDDREILSVLVEVSEESELAEVRRQVMETARFVDWMDVQQRLIRRGEVDDIPEGYELLWASYRPATRHTRCGYQVLFPRADRSVFIQIDGQGDIDSFDRRCREIVSSLELIAAGRGTGRPGAEARPEAFPKRGDNALVLRTDFSDDAAWESLCEVIRRPVGEFRAYVDFLSDPRFEGLDVGGVLKLDPEGSGHSFLFLADRTALAAPERPILVVDLDDEPGRTFRVVPSEMWSVENNLSIANMSFSEFADDVDPDGVFRGFPGG